jgi:GDP-mannose pyrophosphatase NudK
MSPGGVTEIVHFFIAEYSDAQRTHRGGGWMMKISKCWKSLFSGAGNGAFGEIKDGKAVILLQYLQTTG